MALIKRDYTDEETLITAKNLNDIQDAILTLEDGLFTVDDDRSGAVITITDAAKRGFRSFNIYGKTTQAGIPSPEAPVTLVSAGGNGSIDVTVAGKNLLQCNAASISSQGVTFTIGHDGTVDASGTATQNAYLLIGRVNLAPGKYFLNGDLTGSSSTHRLFITNGTREYNNYTADREFEVTEDGTWSVSILINAGTTVSGAKFRPMVRLATSSDSIYESYKAQVMTISTPNGLPGIPVSSGGNYTDIRGQQWICDEIDLYRGMYVQRLFFETVTAEKLSVEDNVEAANAGKIVYYRLMNKHLCNDKICLVMCDKAFAIPTDYRGDKVDLYRCYAPESNPDVVCLRFPVSAGEKTIDEAKADFTGATICYAAISPIEIPLSAEELAAYAALYTYKDNTTVSNSGYAYMDLEYVMDAKKYIDGLVAGGSTGGPDGGLIIPATVE